METFGWLFIVWIVALCPPIGVVIGILALISASGTNKNNDDK